MIKSIDGSMRPLTSLSLQLKKSTGSFLDVLSTFVTHLCAKNGKVGDVVCSMNFPYGVRATPNMCRDSAGSIVSCRKRSIFRECSSILVG